MSEVWRGVWNADPSHVDDELLRVPQLRCAMVGGARPAALVHEADGMTSSSPLPMAVINVSRPLVPWNWRHVLMAPMQVLALAWGLPFLVFIALLPFGLLIAGAVRLGRMILGH